ncbi:hypothetical protein DVH24_000054 [Malus domestica]|uniref:Defective in cullin neddylation protein n=1 Tax=Malus domestica TaxID=3750 RepID=A0A498J1C6_MALDO|nr:hypothetical protein DVH24_000054 [Malus domestica]
MRRSAIKAANKELERIDAVFISYENASSGLIDPEGIERLCSDLEVDHTDVRVLMLAWKMKAEKQGYFTLEEWRVGLKGLRVDNVNKLKKALPELEKEVRRPSNFVDFYSYAFEYCLTEEKQKSIDIDSICELLNIVLGSQYHLQVDLFTQYLKIQNDYKVINMDQWMGFYRFCNEISFPDLSNYDPELAWPLILDNFVDWIQDKQSQIRMESKTKNSNFEDEEAIIKGEEGGRGRLVLLLPLRNVVPEGEDGEDEGELEDIATLFDWLVNLFLSPSSALSSIL